MKQKKGYQFLLLFLITSILFLPSSIATAEREEEKNFVNIYFFHSKDCSHCKIESKYLDTLEKKYSNLTIYRYEVHEEQNQEIIENVEEIYQIKMNSVPVTIIGDTIYTGYLEEKSNLKFIKTIEYYSKYSYTDSIGEYLQVETLPYYQKETDIPSLENFIDSYENYQLIGPLYTDDLDITLNANILGILSKCNIVNIFSMLIVLLLLLKIGGERNKIGLLTFYLVISYLLSITYIIPSELFTLGIEILILILFMLGLLGYSKNKKRQYLIGNIFIVIAIIKTSLENKWFGKYVSIFKSLLSLHKLSGMDKLIYYLNYLLILMIMDLIFVLVCYMIKRLLQKKTRI